MGENNAHFSNTMKLSVIASLVCLSVCLVLGSAYLLVNQIIALSDTDSRLAMNLILCLTAFAFSTTCLLGIFLNRKWGLYVFLSFIFLFTGIYIQARIDINGSLISVDLFVISGALIIFALVLPVIYQLKTNCIFTRNQDNSQH